MDILIKVIERLENKIKILEDDNISLRVNNKMILDQRNEYMELVEEQREIIKKLEKENEVLEMEAYGKVIPKSFFKEDRK